MSEFIQYNLSNETVIKLMQDAYDMRVIKVQRLHGYTDKNFLVTEEGETNNEYVLKIKICGYSKLKADLCYEAMSKLKEHGINTTYPIMSIKQSVTPEVTVADDKGVEITCPIELLPFLPGRSISESELSPDQLLQLSHGVGSFCGLICKYLMGTDDMKIVEDDYIWNSVNFCLLTDQYLENVKNRQLHNIIQQISEEFKSLAHVFPTLRKGYIHNDVSNTNIILMSNSISSSTKYEDVINRFGIIDFEDTQKNYMIFELSICMAYMMIEGVGRNVENVLDVGTNVLSGFQIYNPLTEQEKDVLYISVLARFCSSYVMAQYGIAQDPSNEEYLSLQSSKCPFLIDLFWNKGRNEVMKHWNI